jgi:hypothetical protein
VRPPTLELSREPLPIVHDTSIRTVDLSHSYRRAGADRCDRTTAGTLSGHVSRAPNVLILTEARPLVPRPSAEEIL